MHAGWVSFPLILWVFIPVDLYYNGIKYVNMTFDFISFIRLTFAIRKRERRRIKRISL